ncbi:DNA-processing protein DprA [Pseudooceanicola marinus]|uniref:DNA-processing protein DprA n=1 Tax=Pseudooceanicola marinus TaxID=396013 RepID=UPI001CD7E8FB|nr:DNA-processing protein DprA [Pseudooceanicola marinus]MCA1336693.1 DNA-processing protein DprA [Pseudooceanicola marinus]
MVVDNHPSTHPPLPPTTEDERLSWLRLLRSRRIGPVTFYRMLAEHGNAAVALEALPEVARAAGLSDYAPCPLSIAEQELARGQALGAQLVARGEAAYPSALDDLPDAPPLLWLRGRAELLMRPGVAVVGARQASSLGLRMARALATDLGQAGQVVISGLARGIDAVAHEAAIETGTIAVFPGGLDQIYPLENRRLADRIAVEGLCLTEQPPGLAPAQRHFPLRNRLVSGLARAVVVVEAATKSGTLNTARHALDQGREVLAVPGHPFEARASGCNLLLRDGAGLVRGARDVLEVLGDPAPRPRAPVPQPDAHPEAPPPPSHGLRDIARLHAQILDRIDAAPVEEEVLLATLDAPARQVAPALTDLELEGRIRRQPGGLIARGENTGS